jgi:hypothetical protein
LEGDEVRLYLIWPDGTTELLETRPASVLYRRVEAVRPVLVVLVIAALVWLIVAQAVDFLEVTAGFAVAVVFACLVGFFVSEGVGVHEIQPPGEQWERIGGDD